MTLSVCRIVPFQLFQVFRQLLRLWALPAAEMRSLPLNLFPNDFCPDALLRALGLFQLLPDLCTAVITAACRCQFCAWVSLMIAENDLYLALNQLTNQIRSHGNRRALQDQYTNLTDMDSFHRINRPHHQIIQLVIHLGIAGYDHDPPAHDNSSESRSVSCSNTPVTD